MNPSYLFLLLINTFLLLTNSTNASSSSSSRFKLLAQSSPWSSFLNLTGCREGDRNPVLPSLKTYLHHYGYLPDSADLSNDSFTDILTSALQTYQRNFNLPITSSLDLPTIKQLITPRCGLADVINGTTSMLAGKTPGRGLFTYFPGSPTWQKRHLTYAFTEISSVSASRSQLSKVFSRAFSRWAAVTLLTFKEVGKGESPDITIGFYSGDHGDGEAFDGVLGTLAHAFSPADGRFHLDAAENWGFDGGERRDGVDLESVAVHEIGHLLGMGHSSEGEAVMFPTIGTGTRRVELASDDVEGVQRLYGSNPGFRKGQKEAAVGSTTESNGDGGGEETFRWGTVFGLVMPVMLVGF